jgi:NAD(P)-dependent dehydrogenase (short-subunit alcohol dehydrogenase family)
MGRVDGKIAVVTGSAMGNGLGAARKLAQEGAKIALTDVSNELSQTAEKLSSEGLAVEPFHMDVRSFEQVREVVNEITVLWGRIDILVNNAGICILKHFLDMNDEDRDYHWNVNMNGIWNCTKAVLPLMVKQGYGKIVNLSSVTGPIVVDVGDSAYGATKAAILGFTRAIALEFAQHNITVNAICPGYILTPGVQQVAADSEPENPQSVIDSIARRVPMGRLGTIEEIGNLVAFLASDESSYITGTHIVIDGGAILPETSGSVHA